MNLPFDNDTRTIVQKLAKKNLKADKTRNVLIIMWTYVNTLDKKS